MTLLFLLAGCGAFFVSGTLFYFLPRTGWSALVSTIVPVLILVGYYLYRGDEFFFFLIEMTLAVCYSLMGSLAGIFVVAQFF